MNKAWLWLKDNWRVVAVGAVAVLGAVVGGAFVRELRRPDERIRRELKASRAGTQAAERLLTTHADDVVRYIEEEHAARIKDFDNGQKAKLVALRSNPVQLARWLARLSDPAGKQ